MNQEHETLPMKSTNFEFLRAQQPKLADDAAGIECLLHERPAQAVNLMRSFAEHLLHAFVIARGRDGVLVMGDMGKRTIEFEQLLLECEKPSVKWRLSADQLRLFRQIKSEGNKAVHDADYQASLPVRLLETLHKLAGSIAKAAGWEAPQAAYREPPRGGEDFAEARRQRDAARAESQQPVDLSHWIIRDPLPQLGHNEFVGREFLFRETDRFLAANSERILLIEGQLGRGKSTALRHFLAEKLPTGITPVWFFFEDGKSSLQEKGWIRHLYATVLKTFGLTEHDRDMERVEPDSLVHRLRRRLDEVAKACPDRRLVIVIDAIDEAGPAKDVVLTLLREILPSTVQIIATARRQSSRRPRWSLTVLISPDGSTPYK